MSMKAMRDFSGVAFTTPNTSVGASQIRTVVDLDRLVAAVRVTGWVTERAEEVVRAAAPDVLRREERAGLVGVDEERIDPCQLTVNQSVPLPCGQVDQRPQRRTEEVGAVPAGRVRWLHQALVRVETGV